VKYFSKKLRYLIFAQRERAMLAELSGIPVVESGVQVLDGRQTPFVILKNGRCLFGRAPDSFERAIYRRWKSVIAETVSEDTIRVAMDVILRYLYPHAMPQLTMPYTRSQRQGFQKQHRDTIRDLPKLSTAEIETILKVFELKKGGTFIDGGTYMGYGVVRMADETAGELLTFAVEADPAAQWYLEKNVEANNLTNVVIIRKAISNSTGSSQFFQTERQANSLIPSVVHSRKNIPIPTVTIDEIVREAGLNSVDRISLTINGAELEAVQGMKNVVEASKQIRISLAGWYKREGHRIADLVEPILCSYGLQVAIGRLGSVFAWKSDI
jgi:FkbM family methyltransferase